jgi:hypothetical protein
MTTVTYAHQFSYTYDVLGEPFPILQIEISSAQAPGRRIELEAYLDSGAQSSLFDGTLCRVLGIDLFAGRHRSYGSNAGAPITGFLHPVNLQHAVLGQLQLEVGFSTVTLRRNLLGRDFFNLVQIGFRERQQLFFVTAHP